jgi:hypothetical protein
VFKKILLLVDLTDKHGPALNVAADLEKSYCYTSLRSFPAYPWKMNEASTAGSIRQRGNIWIGWVDS